MINTKDFKTKSEILEKSMPRILGNNQHKGKTIVAIDGGYSAVKGVSPNKVFRYPSFAKKAPQTLEIVGKVNATDLQYRDNITGEVWLVGASAETMLEQGDIEATTDDSLYTRYRYDIIVNNKWRVPSILNAPTFNPKDITYAQKQFINNRLKMTNTKKK